MIAREIAGHLKTMCRCDRYGASPVRKNNIANVVFPDYVASSFYKGLLDWENITQQASVQAHIVFGGNEAIYAPHGTVWPWHSIKAMMQQIYRHMS